MAIGLVGQKLGMTRVFGEDGTSTSVSVVQVQPNRITQIKTLDSDGYNAIQITMGQKKQSRVNKAAAGHFAKAGVDAGHGLWEFRVSPEELKTDTEEALKPGSEISVAQFQEGQIVDVTGITKGKGFAGVVKRHHFAMQDATHGNSLSHRAHGSIGQCQTPGRVFKGKKMAGHMGSKGCTTQNLKIVRVDTERNLLLVAGAIPGSKGGDVLIKPAVKAKAEEK